MDAIAPLVYWLIDNFFILGLVGFVLVVFGVGAWYLPYLEYQPPSVLEQLNASVPETRRPADHDFLPDPERPGGLINYQTGQRI